MARALTRRALIGAVALGAACAAAGLPGCSGGDVGAGSEPSASSPLAGRLGGRLVLRTTCPELLVNAVVPAFMEETGASVRIVPCGAAELLAWQDGGAPEGEAVPDLAPDVVWGADPSWYEGSEGRLEEYISGENDAMREGCRCAGGRVTPVTRDVAVIAVGEGAQEGTEVAGYESLLVEPIPGMVALEDPSLSERGLAHLAGISAGLSDRGADAPWECARALLRGGAAVVSSDPLDPAATGGRALTLSSEQRVMQARLLGQHAPEPVYPVEGALVTCSCTAIVAGCPNLRQARAWVDFVTGRRCQELVAAEALARPARADVPDPDGLPDVGDPVVPDRQALLATWASVLDGTWEPGEGAS